MKEKISGKVFRMESETSKIGDRRPCEPIFINKLTDIDYFRKLYQSQLSSDEITEPGYFTIIIVFLQVKLECILAIGFTDVVTDEERNYLIEKSFIKVNWK